MEQTAIKFLFEKYKSQGGLLFAEDFEQAEKLFKKQVLGGCKHFDQFNVQQDWEDYYSETFKSE